MEERNVEGTFVRRYFPPVPFMTLIKTHPRIIGGYSCNNNNNNSAAHISRLANVIPFVIKYAANIKDYAEFMVGEGGAGAFIEDALKFHKNFQPTR